MYVNTDPEAEASKKFYSNFIVTGLRLVGRARDTTRHDMSYMQTLSFLSSCIFTKSIVKNVSATFILNILTCVACYKNLYN